MRDNSMEYAGYVLILIFVAIIAWLSNREMDKTLIQMRESKKILTDERNFLEKTVQRRTMELIASEQTRNTELERNIIFGELSRGLFHDLMNPLSSLTLYVENMATKSEYSNQNKEMMDKTIAVSRRMETFMNSIRHATSETSSHSRTYASLNEELRIIYDLLAYKARMAGTKIFIQEFDDFSIHINPFRLHQLLLNIVSNAVDACIASSKRYKSENLEGVVNISASKNGEELMIVIEDNGCGIPRDRMNDIFNHSFTTKTSGTGIGLITVKNIVNEELHGKISIKSEVDVGTVCTIAIPLSDN